MGTTFEAVGPAEDDGGEREPLMMPGEVAAMFRLDTRTVARWANAGKIRSVRTPGGHHRYFAADIRAMLARREAQ